MRSELDVLQMVSVGMVDKRDLRTFSQNYFAGVLPGHLPQKLYSDLQSLQEDLDNGLWYYNNERTHQGKMCCGRTPMDTLRDGKRIWAEKNLNQI